jgi:hypothetical protein
MELIRLPALCACKLVFPQQCQTFPCESGGQFYADYCKLSTMLAGIRIPQKVTEAGPKKIEIHECQVCV